MPKLGSAGDSIKFIPSIGDGLDIAKPILMRIPISFQFFIGYNLIEGCDLFIHDGTKFNII
jgi:hypothetical protein